MALMKRLLIPMLIAGLLTGCVSNGNDASHSSARPSTPASPNASAEPSPVKPAEHSDKPNLIVIQLEAYQSFILNKSVGGQEITPNLNRLIEDSAYFSRFYLQNGYGNTSDAEFMANTSLHPFEKNKSIALNGADKEYPGLPRLLKQAGYATATLHTNTVTFWNRKELYSALGFERYYDKAYFGNEKSIAFGSDDDILYAKSMSAIMDMKEPFYAQLVSMSSHYPFKIPASYQSIKLPEIYEGNIVGDYLQATRYADEALGRFFAEMKKNDLWNNTVIAIYGDHTGLVMSVIKEQEAIAMKDLLGRPYDQIDALGVPFILHGPNIKAGVYDTVGGHMDIMPTLANLLGVQTDTRLFGYDLFRNTEHPVAVRSNFGPDGAFIYQDIYYDTKANTVTNVKTREVSDKPDASIMQMEQDQLLRFKQSDELIQALPQKVDSFGKRIELTENVKVYREKDEQSTVLGEISSKTQLDTFQHDGEWYQIVGEDGSDQWLRTQNPIFETYKKIRNPVKARAYVEPDITSDSPIEIGAQNLTVLKEWEGTGWYQVSTWTGKDLWIRIN